jgi:hypothetical protein
MLRHYNFEKGRDESRPYIFKDLTGGSGWHRLTLLLS